MREKLEQLFESKKIEITLFLFGFTLVGVGVFLWKSAITPTKIELIGKTSTEVGETRTTNSNKMIYIDVAGEVNKPGVVGLISGARVNEAIASAGGVSTKADLEWIAKNLNQAKILSDGEKIYIPGLNSKGEDITRLDKQVDKININSASESELDKLPGIGPATATKIINSRPYSQIEELKDRKIITIKVWEQIKEMISAW